MNIKKCKNSLFVYFSPLFSHSISSMVNVHFEDTIRVMHFDRTDNALWMKIRKFRNYEKKKHETKKSEGFTQTKFLIWTLNLFTGIRTIQWYFNILERKKTISKNEG